MTFRKQLKPNQITIKNRSTDNCTVTTICQTSSDKFHQAFCIASKKARPFFKLAYDDEKVKILRTIFRKPQL